MFKIHVKFAILMLIYFSTISYAQRVSYKLRYFNIRGRAEFLRYMFAFANQAYNDDRIEDDEWPKIKPTMPFGQVPILEVRQGKNIDIIAQSSAIGKFLAKKFNIAGSNDIETAYVDMYTGQLLDLFDQIARYSMETNITVKERLFNETWSRNLAFFESRLNLTNTGFLIGSKITWADLYLSSVLDNLGNRTNSVLEKFNRVKRLDQRVKAIPNVNRWLKQRPVTEF